MSLFRNLLMALCAVSSVSVAAPALARKTDHVRAVPSEARSVDNFRLAWDDRPRDQDRAFRAQREGRSMPLPQLERRVIPHMGGADYLGPEMRGSNLRMKFLDRGQVIWVDVDPRTGRIIGKSDD